MLRKKYWLGLLVGGAFLVGCGSPSTPAPSETPEPTSTPVPTATSTGTPLPTATLTSTPTPEPTPDLRVIDSNPRDLVDLELVLPDDGRFYLTYESPNRNSEILSAWGVEEGRKYLEESGRVDGWSIEYERGTRTVFAPEWVHANAIVYETVDGPEAAASLRENNEPCTDQSSFDSWGLAVVEDGYLSDADLSYLCLFREMQASGKNYHVYYSDIKYKNIGLQVWAGGLEDDFSKAWVVDFIVDLMGHIKGFELSESVTWSP